MLSPFLSVLIIMSTVNSFSQSVSQPPVNNQDQELLEVGRSFMEFLTHLETKQLFQGGQETLPKLDQPRGPIGSMPASSAGNPSVRQTPSPAQQPPADTQARTAQQPTSNPVSQPPASTEESTKTMERMIQELEQRLQARDQQLLERLGANPGTLNSNQTAQTQVTDLVDLAQWIIIIILKKIYNNNI